MSAPAELVNDLLRSLAGVQGLRPATPTNAGLSSWGLNWDTMAVDINQEAEDSGGGGHTVVVRVVATRLPLSPVVRQAELALLAVLTASGLPITQLRLVITDVDGAAFG